MSPYILWSIILVEGYVALAAQMLTIRQLMPFVGNSVSVTSLIIGLFLLALAFGYQRGGLVQINPEQRLIRNFTFAALWLGFGLSYAFLEAWFIYLHNLLPLNLYVFLIGYLFLITVPMVYWLGQTVPIVMNLWKTQQRAGEIGGRVLEISTIGSFLGAVITSVIVMNVLGLGWTVFIAAALLLFIAGFLLIKEKFRLLRVLGYVLALGILFWLNVIGTQKYFIATNNYAQYQLLENRTVDGKIGNILFSNQSPSSFLTPNKEGFVYIEKIKNILFNDLHLRNQAILVLGAGGFTISAQGDQGNQFTYVDIDPNIKNIVQEHFLKDIHGAFVGADARVFVQQTQEKYAAVIVDAYSHQLTIPAHLLTIEFFAAINHVLMPEGVAIFNMIVDPFYDDPYSRAIDAGLRAVFKSCVSYPLEYVDAATNIIYVCKFNPDLDMAKVLLGKGSYYTDDLNRATWDLQFLQRR